MTGVQTCALPIFLMGYIKKNDFTAFGWYRIVVGVLVLGYFVFESMGMLP